MRISDWSSDVCASDLHCWWAVARSEELKSDRPIGITCAGHAIALWREPDGTARAVEDRCPHRRVPVSLGCILPDGRLRCGYHGWTFDGATRSEEHTSELQSLMRISYAVFCLKKKKNQKK